MSDRMAVILAVRICASYRRMVASGSKHDILMSILNNPVDSGSKARRAMRPVAVKAVADVNRKVGGRRGAKPCATRAAISSADCQRDDRFCQRTRVPSPCLQPDIGHLWRGSAPSRGRLVLALEAGAQELMATKHELLASRRHSRRSIPAKTGWFNNASRQDLPGVIAYCQLSSGVLTPTAFGETEYRTDGSADLWKAGRRNAGKSLVHWSAKRGPCPSSGIRGVP